MKSRIFNMRMIIVLSMILASNTLSAQSEIKISESEVIWKGYKVTGHHEGTINLKEGVLKFDGDKLTGGSFIIDMTTLQVTDQPVERRGRLEGHLKSDDFFGVENHPESTLIFTSVEGEKDSYTIIGDLSIKGTTHPIEFLMIVSENSAKTSLKIDRTKYNIKFRSASFFDGLKNKAISNKFDINVSLKFDN